MRRMGVMTTLMIVCLCCVGVVASASSKGDGFDGLVRAVDERYHVHGRGVPMMWAMSLVARGATRGGVRGMRVVTYESFPAGADRTEIDRMVKAKLGAGWTPMVRSRSERETSLVYVQPDGVWVRMVVVNLEKDELEMVRMEMNPEALARWEDEGH